MKCSFSYPFNKVRWPYRTLFDSITLVDLEFLKKALAEMKDIAKELFDIPHSDTQALC